MSGRAIARHDLAFGIQAVEGTDVLHDLFAEDIFKTVAHVVVSGAAIVFLSACVHGQKTY